MPHWSPDGQWIAYDGRWEGNSEIYAIRADGGAPRRITSHPAEDFVPSWSRDGRWIYFVSDRSGRNETWKRPFEGGAAVQVTRNGGGPAFESMDGRYIYYSKMTGADLPSVPLWRARLDGSEETKVLPQIINAFMFAVTAKSVYFSPDGRVCQRLDLASGKVSKVGDCPNAGDGITVTLDDTYVLWAHHENLTSDLMLVEGFR
jgi:dipeptidyl aminopeptidase/acylaminoacyl peptidase